ncbi:hypothetical protein Pfo_029376 [Paulownia fortunei]|nr:hypothetical protein Pfo_029376 [Paulownia fortunei]
MTSKTTKHINTTNQEHQNTITHQTMSTSPIDPFDPLFLHASDHPSMTLVPKVLNGTNYAMWRCSMFVSLSAKNKLGYIKGTISTPEESDPKYARLANRALYVETPSEIWLDLQERFSQGDFFLITIKFNGWLKMCSPIVPCTCGGLKQLTDKEEK